MGPCVRRDDPLRACATPIPHQHTAQFIHMRFPCLPSGEVELRSNSGRRCGDVNAKRLTLISGGDASLVAGRGDHVGNQT